MPEDEEGGLGIETEGFELGAGMLGLGTLGVGFGLGMGEPVGEEGPGSRGGAPLLCGPCIELQPESTKTVLIPMANVSLLTFEVMLAPALLASVVLSQTVAEVYLNAGNLRSRMRAPGVSGACCI